MVENREVIFWFGSKYTMKEGETLDSVMEAVNDGVLCFMGDNFRKITDLEGNTLKEMTT